MTQAVSVYSMEKPKCVLEASNASVSVVQTGNTTLLDIGIPDGVEKIFLLITVATQAIDAFVVQGKATPADTYATLLSAAGDYTSTNGFNLMASGDLTAQAVGVGWLLLNTRGLSNVKVLASGGNATPSVVSVSARGT